MWTQKTIDPPGSTCSNDVFGDPVFGVGKTCELSAIAPAPAPQTVTAWVRTAGEGEALTVTGTVRYGAANRWATKAVTGPMNCNSNDFGADPAPGILKTCEVQMTVPAVTQIAGAMPVVNMALTPAPIAGHAAARVRSVWRNWDTGADCKQGDPSCSIPSAYQTVGPNDIGAFRTVCDFARMANDDPIVFPGLPGASHLHTFTGNTGVDAFSTVASIAGSGNSTCHGGTLNRSSYWFPAMIDTANGQPLVPESNVVYYKGSYEFDIASVVQPMPP
ncbi:MAG: DUF1996 domain-containing protein, partial [Burkholderiaceae bacterium]